MKLKKNYLAIAILSASLVACGGSDDDDDDVSVTPTPTPSEQPSFVSCSTDGCTLEGTVNEDFTLTADKTWFLKGQVKVGAGNVGVNAADVAALKGKGPVLTIEPGTNVKALNDGVLIITRGSKIMAEGTKTAPITFSSLDDDFDGLGEWGGVIVQGFAPHYGAGNTGACYGDGTVCNVTGEGGPGIGYYGGNDPADNSGVIKYVRIAEGGKSVGQNNEINGLTLMGVGHGTEIEYVQVHNNLDDAVEWFGGTVNAKYLVLTGNDDDDIDFDEGWKGNVQYAIIRKDPVKAGPSGSNDPRGIEANSSDADYVPQTEGALANILIVGSEVNKAANSKGDSGQPGARLRGSVKASLYNSAVINFKDCIRIDDSDTDGNGTMSYSEVALANVIGQCDSKFYAKRSADSENGTIGANSVTLDAAAALTDAHAKGVTTAMTAVDNGSGFAFDNTDYIGAVKPGTAAADAWWADWIIPGTLDGIKDQGQVK